MAKIRSYTTIEQSKVLAEILPLESADMYYDIDSYGIQTTPEVLMTSVVRKKDIPCWSLSALLDVLPDEVGDNHYLTLDKEGKEYCCCYEDNNGNSFRHCFSDNPIDACVAMIEKLHELKML